MPAKAEEELTTVHLHVYKSDIEYIDALFCRSGQRTVGRAKALRTIIRAWRIQNERKRDAKPVKFDPIITEIIGEPVGSD